MPEELNLGRLVAEIALENQSLMESAEETIDTLRDIDSTAKAVNPEVAPKVDAGASQKVTASIQELTETVEKQEEAVQTLNRSYQDTVHKQGESSAATKKLDTAVASVNESLSDNKQRFDDSSNSAQGYKQAANDSSTAAEQLTQKTEKLNEGFTVTKGIVASLISEGLTKLSSQLLQIGKDVIQTGEEFTSSMSEVGAISGATAEELKLLEQTAREYGASTKFSATEAAQALKYMALAGWDVEQSTAALGGILDLAAASGMELAQASDMVTDYLSAFGMAAEQSSYMADLLTYAQGNSNTSAGQLGEAYKNCAANLNAAGQDIETVTSLLEAMANQGKKGSEAGTMLSAIMRDLTDKMDNGAVKIGTTSVQVKDASGNFRDLTDILKDTEKAVNGMGTADRAAALSATFTQEAISGINLVLNEGMTAVTGYENALRDSTGTASDAAALMSDNLSGDIKTMQSALDELKLKIFDDAETPLRSVVQTVTDKVIPAGEVLINNFDKIVPVIAAATSAMISYKASLAILSIIKGLQQGYAALTAKKAADTAATVTQTSATNAATAAQTGLNTAMAANPIGLVVAALGLLVGGLTSYALMADSAADSTDKLSESLDRIKNNASDKINSTESEAAVIKTLGARYEELRTKTDKTTEDYQELTLLSEQLAEKLGITTKEIRTQSGEYAELNKIIEETTSSMINQAKAEAAQTALKEAYEVQYKAKKAYWDKVQELVDEDIFYYENGELITDDKSRLTSQAILDEVGELNKLSDAYADATDTVKFYTDELNEVNRELAKNADASADSADAAKDGSNAADNVTTSLEDNDAALKKITDSLDTLNSSLSVLNKAQKEVSNNGEISLNTLNELVKKYPELTDTVNEYISGVKTESDVIAALKKVYEEDVDDYNNAVKSKTVTTTSFYSQLLSENAQLVNDMKEKYEVDLSNYTTVQEAKADVAAKVQAKIRAELYKTAYQQYIAEETRASNFGTNSELLMANISGNANSFYADTLKNSPQALQLKRDTELADTLAKEAGDRAAREISAVVGEYYAKLKGTASADSMLDSASGSDSGTGNKKKSPADQKTSSRNSDAPTWYTSGRGVDQVSGKTYSDSKMNWIDKVKSLDKLTIQEEIRMLEELETRTDNSADDQYQIALRLYKARTQLAEQEAAKQEELLQKEYERIEKLASKGQLTTRQEISQLERIYQKYKLTTEQKAALDEKLYQKRQKLRQEDVDALDRLGDAVIAALRNKYEEQQKLEESRISESITSWQKWEDETCASIQGQINALDELKNAHDEENQREEYENKRQALELQLRYEKDDYNRKQLRKEIAALDNSEHERLYNLQIEEQKKALQEQMDSVRTLSSAKRDELADAKNQISSSYSELINDMALQGEAKELILNSSQDELVRLINQYAPSYEMLGQSLGESLYSGMAGRVGDISEYVSKISSRTDTQSERKTAAAKLNTYSDGANKRLSACDLTSCLNVIDQLTANVANYKNQMALTANAAADSYYNTTQKYYQNSVLRMVSQPVNNIYMTVNFNGQVSSPIQIKRQMQSVAYDIARQIS